MYIYCGPCLIWTQLRCLDYCAVMFCEVSSWLTCYIEILPNQLCGLCASVLISSAHTNSLHCIYTYVRYMDNEIDSYVHTNVCILTASSLWVYIHMYVLAIRLPDHWYNWWWSDLLIFSNTVNIWISAGILNDARYAHDGCIEYTHYGEMHIQVLVSVIG